mmetsp:Transcript_43840/g.44491  ORF Transcript_43840/g.44491 Transcript_43840/m.44491 type:complete len:82 (+) Transcript_43840:77-322(+)
MGISEDKIILLDDDISVDSISYTKRLLAEFYANRLIQLKCTLILQMNTRKGNFVVLFSSLSTRTRKRVDNQKCAVPRKKYC